ncbi:MAG: class I SAM-dependent methyltransferase [Gammaproteobacteria bacterium]|nr:class I SAM-dependent methyltransferase [Gammaproteobacteria bacterium]
MSPEEIAKSYDSLAEHWNGDQFPRENGIDQHRRALGFSDHCGNALDIGCGSSGRILDLLLHHGFNAEGLDISNGMIELAMHRHPQITFYHADICQWEFPKKYDFISAWDSIWHIPLQQHDRVLRKILAALSPGGVCIFTTGGVDEPSETLDAAMGPPMYHSAPGIPAILEIIAKSGSACRHLEYDQWPDLHVYVIVQKLDNTE